MQSDSHWHWLTWVDRLLGVRVWVVSRAGRVDPLPAKLLRYRLVALVTVLALLALITVSGPHLVHHLTEHYSPIVPSSPTWHGDDHHIHTQPALAELAHDSEAHSHPAGAGHQPEGETSPWPDCLVLFLLYSTPVAALVLAGVSVLVVVIVLEFAVRVWLSTDTRRAFYARAPPA